MSTPEDRLAAMGLTVPVVVKPLAAYVPAVRSGSRASKNMSNAASTMSGWGCVTRPLSLRS